MLPEVTSEYAYIMMIEEYILWRKEYLKRAAMEPLKYPLERPLSEWFEEFAKSPF